jgi:hypothetical protein
MIELKTEYDEEGTLWFLLPEDEAETPLDVTEEVTDDR